MLDLLRLGLARNRSPEDYRDMQSYISRRTITELIERGVNLSEARVLELAAGKGGYSAALASASAEFVASDIEKDPTFDSNGIPWVCVDVMKRFPFDDARFDFIYCSSLVEHIPTRDNLVTEAYRVLAPGGHMLLSFPPWWSLLLVGGHTFKPFHLLGERIAVAVANRGAERKARGYADAYGDRDGLYPLTIADISQTVSRSQFETRDVYTRASRLNTARLPGLLADLTTWHVCFLLRKGSA